MAGFVDEAQLHAKAGNGGAGAVAFRREAHVAKGGPDGGDGGRGGDVWLVATHNQASLLSFRDHPHRRAGDGGHGQGKRKHGANGDDLLVPVPVGLMLRDREGGVAADLAVAGARFRAAHGGRGGRGNASFGSNRRRAPAFAEQAELGEERWYDLELKLVADVALVGFPNVGKSTLVARVSAAKPKIADYPFTTLQPHLGVVRLEHGDDEVEFVVADVPGLVEGAAEGRGLGHRFLRHVERARALLVLLDLASPEGRSAEEQERVLLDELRRYRPALLERPRVVIGSRCDLEPTTGGDQPALRVSAVTGEGIDELLRRLADVVVAGRAAEALTPAAGEVVIHRPAVEDVVVERADDGAFVVLGRAALRAVALSDLTDAQALDEAQRRLRRLGVEKALARAGCRHGDTVRVGDFSFDYVDDDAPVTGGDDDARPAARRRRA